MFYFIIIFILFIYLFILVVLPLFCCLNDLLELGDKFTNLPQVPTVLIYQTAQIITFLLYFFDMTK